MIRLLGKYMLWTFIISGVVFNATWFLASLKGLAFLVPASHAGSQPIIVFTSNQYQITGADRQSVQIYNLDQQSAEEKKLAAELPGNQAAAAKEVERRISRYRQSDLQRIWAPRILAQKYDIRKVPAVVFNDGEAVVYGVTDVNKAIEKWQEWRNVRK